MASSSSPMRQQREVFLSFRGEDTRYNFTGHLYKALREKAIDIFIDNDLERGVEITPALLKTIEESMISIVIFSKNYATSPWCLDELSKIIECKKTNGQMVVPIFYHVDPSDVVEQTGSFAEAFAEHEERFKDKVERWRAALTEVGNLAGHHLQNDKSETIHLHDITENIMKKLYHSSSGDFNEHHTSSSDFNSLVGIDSRIEKIMSLLRMQLESACIIVGIWGMGGIGKTTIAKAIYDQISGQFPDCYFLENVREESEKCGVDSLRKELLGQILKDENIKRSTVDLKNPFPKKKSPFSKRLGRKKVLIVLDDVNDSKQLESIIGLDQFGKGSRIIITTRNREVLKDGVHEVYMVKELNDREALQLFCLKAFKQNDPTEDFMDLSNEVVEYARGIPLALEVLGRFLFRRSKDEWKSALDKLKETPNRDIQKVLRISYDSLDPKEKDIFCDIACFFKGTALDKVIKILNGCGLYAGIGISVLTEKSLITISDNKLRMHDLLQEMGWEIVREVSEEPGERSRLWNHEDVCHVLTEETGTKAVKGISMDLSNISKVNLSSKAFKRMNNLRFLKFYYPRYYEHFDKLDTLHFREEFVRLSNKLSYLHWERYPFESLPPNFHLEKIVVLNLSGSKIKYLWEGTQPLKWLKKIQLEYCKDLIKIPNLSKVAPNLEHLNLYGCKRLVEVHSSIHYLSKLMVLKLGNHKKLKSLPSTVNLKSHRELDLNDGSNLTELLEISGNIEELDNIDELELSRIPVKDFPSSIQYLFRTLAQCLSTLRLDKCNLLKIPNSLGNLSSLEYLSLGGNNFVSIPASIKHLSQLKWLILNNCKRLQSIPELPSCLTWLDLNNCKRLQSIPELPSCLRCILATDCISLQTISISSIRVTGKEKMMMMFDFSRCLKLDQLKIEAEAQLIIQHLTTALRIEKNFYDDIHYKFRFPFRLVYPGSEIPEWFSYRSRGSLVTAQLPQHRGNSKFFGLALCAVIASEKCDEECDDEYYGVRTSLIDCNMISENGEYDRLSEYMGSKQSESEHVVLWFVTCLNVRKFEDDDWFRKYCYNEALFQFKALFRFEVVEKCGVHPLYRPSEDECNPCMIQSRSPNENFGVVDEGLLEPMAEGGSNDHSFYCDEDELNGPGGF